MIEENKKVTYVAREYCRWRVWDNGDMTSCGGTVLRGGRCAEHLRDEVRELQADIKRHEAGIRSARERLAEPPDGTRVRRRNS